MNDHGVVKVICRIITLLDYVISIFLCFMVSELYADECLYFIKENGRKIMIVMAAILIFMMIVSIIIKYTFQDKSKVTPYRIVDVITRTIFSVPASLILNYVIAQYWYIGLIPNTAIGIFIFVILNLLLRFTLQETMSVTFITSDNL